VTRTGLKTK